MNASKRELLRKVLLQTADMSKPYAVTQPLFEVAVSAHGIRGVEESDLLSEIEYLHEKGLLHPEPKQLSPENKAWKISASGRDYLATEGLA